MGEITPEEKRIFEETMREQKQQIETLTQEIETLKQQRMVNPWAAETVLEAEARGEAFTEPPPGHDSLKPRKKKRFIFFWFLLIIGTSQWQ